MKNYEKINEKLPNIYVSLDDLFLGYTDMESKSIEVNMEFLKFLEEQCLKGNLIILSECDDKEFYKMVKILEFYGIKFDGWNNEDMEIDLSKNDSLYIGNKVNDINDFVKYEDYRTFLFDEADMEEMEKQLEVMQEKEEEEKEEEKEEIEETMEEMFKEVEMKKDDKKELMEALTEIFMSEQFSEMLKSKMQDIINENKKED